MHAASLPRHQPRPTCHAVWRQSARQQPAVAAVRRQPRRLRAQLAPVKGLAAAALQAVHDEPLRLPAAVCVWWGGRWWGGVGDKGKQQGSESAVGVCAVYGLCCLLVRINIALLHPKVAAASSSTCTPSHTTALPNRQPRPSKRSTTTPCVRYPTHLLPAGGSAVCTFPALSACST